MMPSNPEHLARLKARTAARKAARGETPTPPHPAKPARVALPCVHLGDRLPGRPCGSTLRTCTLYGDVTTRFAPCVGADRSCRDCPDYTPQAGGEPRT